jgi:conjugal transfer pilus assembly protein TraU
MLNKIMLALVIVAISLPSVSTPVFAFQAAEESATTVSTTLDVDDLLCPNSRLLGSKMITDVCWSGVFPMFLGGVRLKGKRKYAPEGRATKRTCSCDNGGPLKMYGVTASLYVPQYLLTVTARPFCFPELNGIVMSESLGLVSRFAIGNQDARDDETNVPENDSDYQFHFAAFPIMRILNTFRLGTCNGDGFASFDYLWLSETLPFWTSDPELITTLTPEAAILSNPLGWAAIIYDCVQSSIDQPVDKIFFSSGCQGSLYPLSGETSNSSKEASMSLIANRAFYFVSRIGQLKQTFGNDAVCKPIKQPLWKRTGYRIQKMWPMPELDADSADECITGGAEACTDDEASNYVSLSDPRNTVEEYTNVEGVFDPTELLTSQISSWKIGTLNGICTHPVGQTVYAWGEFRTAPTNDHASYLYFQWKDCCVAIID